jgi:hypothetical protein
MSVSILTLSRKFLYVTLRIGDNKYKQPSAYQCSAIMLTVVTLLWVSRFFCAECYHDECQYAECRYAECHYTECRHAECRGALVECQMRWLTKRLNYGAESFIAHAAPRGGEGGWWCSDYGNGRCSKKSLINLFPSGEMKDKGGIGTAQLLILAWYRWRHWEGA